MTTTTVIADSIFRYLRQSDRYRLTALVELSTVSGLEDHFFWKAYSEHTYPLLLQPEFANLRDTGPHLFSVKPDASPNYQYGFHNALSKVIGNSITCWIISKIQAPELAEHLSQACTLLAPDGDDYLLRFHTPKALCTLHTHRYLPSISNWLKPIHSLWLPFEDQWSALPGGNGEALRTGVPFMLNEACWAELTGEPLMFRLADTLAQAMSSGPKRLGLRGEHIWEVLRLKGEAERSGLTRLNDIVDYITLTVLKGSELSRSAAWKDSLADALAHKAPLAQALRSRLKG